MHKYIFKQTYRYLYTYTYIKICIYIHACIYKYTYTHKYVFALACTKMYGKIHKLLQSGYGDIALKECYLYVSVRLVIFKLKYVLYHKNQYKTKI